MRRQATFGQPAEPSGRHWRVVLVVLVLAVLGGGVWFWRSAGSRPSDSSGAYQAVFLDNGQTYFGYLETDAALLRGYVRLRDVYYLDFRQNPQDPSVNASDLKLTKLGGEVHAPEDYMDINPQHILYVEDLRADSKIAQAISEYASKNQ